METKTKSALQYFKQLAMDNKRIKYPNVPNDCLPVTIYKDTTANGLTKCIIDFLTLKGWQAERNNNTGRHIDRTHKYIDCIGRNRAIGSYEWVRGSGTPITVDISATIAGKSLKIEAKIGHDRQSELQKKYQLNIERSGGLYFIAKHFEQFYLWYNKTFAI